MKFAMLLMIGGCVAGIPGSGESNKGSEVIGRISGDGGGTSEVVLTSTKGWICKGNYSHKDLRDNNEIANFPLICDDGRSGDAVIYLDEKNAKFNVRFELSNSEKGSVNFPLGGASFGSGDLPSKQSWRFEGNGYLVSVSPEIICSYSATVTNKSSVPIRAAFAFASFSSSGVQHLYGEFSTGWLLPGAVQSYRLPMTDNGPGGIFNTCNPPDRDLRMVGERIIK